MNFAGGIDLGGTKIEASLFDEQWCRVETQRVQTDPSSYPDLLNALLQQIAWLQTQAYKIHPEATVTVGIGVPGLVEVESQRMLTANLPAGGKTLSKDLEARCKHPVKLLNDCRAFTLSEAILGAGQEFQSVLGLCLGTGVAGGLVLNGKLMHDKNGAAGEYGHIPLAPDLISQFSLPMLACGCGRRACYETLASGPGLSRLYKALSGNALTAEQIADRIVANDTIAEQAYRQWLAIVAELISTLMFIIDPECIVLGGGLSKMPKLESRLLSAVAACNNLTLQTPTIVLAEGGDSSGTRGAALAALQPSYRRLTS